MEYVLVLDAGAPSARLNAGFGRYGGQDSPDSPPRFLFVPCTEVDTSHAHLLRVRLKDKDRPTVWLPYSHVVGMQEGPAPDTAAMGFTTH
jgi:hypothetical protein